MAFKLSLVADVRGWLKGTADVEKSLDDLSGTLDDLAKDSAQDSDKAADELARNFSDAFDKVANDAKDMNRKTSSAMDDGTTKMSDGLDNVKEESADTAREVAASFGSIEDVAGGIQEVLANAFVGFGPAGVAAGIAAAAGIGLLTSQLQAAADEATATKESVIDLADQIADVGGNPAALQWADVLRGKMNEITDNKDWWELWQSEPKTRFEEWSQAASRFGVEMSTVYKAQTGDAEALAAVNERLTAVQEDLNRQYLESADANGQYNESLKGAADDAGRFRDQVASGAGVLDDATQRANAMADALKEIPDPMARAAEASATMSDNLTDNLSVADDGLENFVKKGKLNLAEWSAELKRRAAETAEVKNFTVTIAPQLSAEALANFAELPTQTQSQIAKAFKSGNKKQQKKIVSNLEAEAKVTKVDVNTSAAQVEASKQTVKFPTTVVEAGAVKGAQTAADQAQRVANRPGNKIEYKTQLNSDGLQSAVNRAAANITPPTIYAKVVARKDVP